MMSQQVRNLELHGLISTRKEGTQRHCSLRNRDVLNMLDCVRRHLYDYLSRGGGGVVLDPEHALPSGDSSRSGT
jgi:hypothetical protein